MSAQERYDTWAATMIAGYTQYLMGGTMITWSGLILKAMRGLKFYGWMQVKENNLCYGASQVLGYGVPPGRYKVWANENRGVFINPVAAYIIYPGV